MLLVTLALLSTHLQVTTRQIHPVRIRFGYGEYVINARPFHPFNDPLYVAALRDSGAGVLRFPGGSMGNFYDWETDTFMPDTVRQLDPKAFVPRDRFSTDADYQAMVQKFTHYLGEWGGKGEIDRQIRGRYGYAAYADLAAKIGAEITYVGNISLAPRGGDPGDHLVAWMRSLKDHGTVVSRLELGNEIVGPRGVHNSQAILNGLYDLDRYMAVAESVSRRVKAIFPRIQIGILSDDIGSKTGEECNQIDRQAHAITTRYPRDFYDAVVIHPYLRCRSRTPESREAHVRRMFATVLRTVTNTVDFARADFPGKEIWITETGYVTTDLSDENNFTGRMITGLMETEYFLGYLDHDDVIGDYVKFFSIADNPPVESRAEGDHPAVKSAMYWDDTHHRIIKSPVYYGYALAAGAARRASARLDVRVDSDQGYSFTLPAYVPQLDAAGRRQFGHGRTQDVAIRVAGVTARAFLGSDGRSLEIVAINRTAQPVAAVVDVDGRPVPGPVALTALSGELFGRNTVEQPERIAPAKAEIAAGRPPVLPPFSIDVISFAR